MAKAQGVDYAEFTFDDRVREMIAERCVNYVSQGNALSLGYNDDPWPRLLRERCRSVDVVEGNIARCTAGRRQFGDPAVKFIHSNFENYHPNRNYDAVVAGSVIEFMDDDKAFLTRLYEWTCPGGLLILTTPNRASLHRRIGVAMGIESSLEELGQQAEQTGAKRLYDRPALLSIVNKTGFNVIDCRAMFLKTVPSAMLANFSDDMLEALMIVGDELPNYGKQLVLIARRPR